MNMHTPLTLDSADVSDVRAKRRRRLIIIGVVLLIAAIAAAYFAFGRGGAASEEKKPAEQATVTVVVPGRTSVADQVQVTGSVAARREMPVGVQGEGGMVTSVLVDAGNSVRSGQVLARLDRAVQSQQVSQLQASVARARADANLAQSQLDRAQTLVGKGFISKADIDTRTAARDGARATERLVQAQLRESQARLGRLDIRAPSDGLVLARMVEAGQIVSGGSGALFRIAQHGQMELRAKVAEQDLTTIRPGQTALVQPVGSARKLSGTVWLVSPVIDPANRQGEVRITLARDRELRPGGFATATVSGSTVNAPLLPESAVLSDAKGNFVYVVGPDNKVERRGVRTGAVSDRGIAVLSGLTGNESVVLSAGAFLNPGETVIPQRAKL